MRKPSQETVDLAASITAVFLAAYLARRARNALIRRALQAR